MPSIEISTVFSGCFIEPTPTEGETWPLGDESIDLLPALREAMLLALPLAPLCRDDCEGPEPDRFPTGVAEDEPVERPADPRWAALDEFTFDDQG